MSLYGICHFMGYVTLWNMSPHGICHFLEYVTLWNMSLYGYVTLWNMSLQDSVHSWLYVLAHSSTSACTLTVSLWTLWSFGPSVAPLLSSPAHSGPVVVLVLKQTSGRCTLPRIEVLSSYVTCSLFIFGSKRVNISLYRSWYLYHRSLQSTRRDQAILQVGGSSNPALVLVRVDLSGTYGIDQHVAEHMPPFLWADEFPLAWGNISLYRSWYLYHRSLQSARRDQAILQVCVTHLSRKAQDSPKIAQDTSRCNI